MTLKQIAISQKTLHEGFQVQVETECPPLAQSGRVDQELIQALQSFWGRLEEEVRGTRGALKLRCG